jgi:hypothetical protein
VSVCRKVVLLVYWSVVQSENLMAEHLAQNWVALTADYLVVLMVSTSVRRWIASVQNGVIVSSCQHIALEAKYLPLLLRVWLSK